MEAVRALLIQRSRVIDVQLILIQSEAFIIEWQSIFDANCIYENLNL